MQGTLSYDGIFYDNIGASFKGQTSYKKIKDEEIIELLEELMDTLTFYKLKEGDEARLHAKYEKNNNIISNNMGISNL